MGGERWKVTAYAVYKTLAISVPTVAEALSGRQTVPRCDARLRRWARSLVEHSEVALRVEGLEHIPSDQACVIMSNHQSHFDIPVLYTIWPRTMRMVAKAELFRVPIWGRAMREAGFVRVTRSGDRAQARAAMAEAASAIGRGISIWIAPEGTRSPDGRLGRFKKGGFILARETGAQVVPVSIWGSHQVLPKHATLAQGGVQVRVDVGPPIAAIGRPVPEVMAEVRGWMLERLPPEAAGPGDAV